MAAAPGDYLAAAQLGLLYLADESEARSPCRCCRTFWRTADSATANRVRMALHMPLVLEERRTDDSPLDPRMLGERSYNAGFLKDALRYFLAGARAKSRGRVDRVEARLDQ